MLLAGRSRFCLGDLKDLTVGLIIGLAIGNAVSIAGKVAVGLSG